MIDINSHTVKPKELTPIQEVPANLQASINKVMTELDAKYKDCPKFLWSMFFVVRDFAFAGAIIYGMNYIPDYVPQIVVYPIYSAVMGTILTGIWVIGHECGHGAFGDNWLQNDIVGFVLHSMLLVPYFSWKYSHNKHHKYTNHLVLGDTHVPPLKRPFAFIHRMLGEDAFAIFDVVMHLVFGWPLYLFTYATGGRTQSDLTSRVVSTKGKSHFWSSSQVMKPSWKIEFSTVGCLVTIGVISYYDLWYWYVGPYLIVNMWLVLYTWLQHTHPDVPHYGTDKFAFLKGALSTIDRPYPYIVDELHHHIGTTHVMHHMNYSIPHYRAQEYTREIKKVLGNYYLYDPMPIHKALVRIAKECVYVESVEGTQYYKK